MEFNLACRVCLREGEMRSIFDKDEKDLMICDKIMRCSNITVKRGMQLPEQICNECYNDLNIAYRFRTNCEKSDQILQSFLDGNIVTDLVVSSENGNIYKYKPPAGLNVKRIKPSKFEAVGIKVESVTTTTDDLNSDIDDDDDDDDDNIIEEDPFENDFIEDNENTSLELQEQPIDTGNLNTPKNISPSRTVTTRRSASKNENSKEFEMIENGEVCTIKPVKTTKGRSAKGKTKTPKAKKVKVLPAQDVTMKPDGTAVIRIRKSEEKKPLKICEICGNTYKYKHALESHMRRHRNEKPFACEICGRAFVINFELRRHMRTHTGQKPYMCRYCGRRFSDFGSRIKHERTHTGERPYACETCGKAFSYSHVLQSHILTHTGEKRYECTLCGKRFTKSHHLKAHTNTHMKHQNKVIVKQQLPTTVSWTQSPEKNIEEVLPTEEIEQKVFLQPDEKVYVHATEDKIFFIKEKKENDDETLLGMI